MLDAEYWMLDARAGKSDAKGREGKIDVIKPHQATCAPERNKVAGVGLGGVGARGGEG